MNKTWTIVRKEWAEVYKNRVVLWTIIGTPLLFCAMAVGTVIPMGGIVSEELGNAPATDNQEFQEFAGELCIGLNASECLETYMATLFYLFFLLLPAILPAVFASYSVVGEKTSRTLEPLLATPITTLELLGGKAIAAVLPAILATWAAIAIYLVAIAGFVSPATMDQLLGPEWMGAALFMGPLLALLSVLAAMMISTRAQDPRTAQQISSLVVLPLVGVVMAQSVGVFFVNTQFIAVACLALLVIDVVLIWLTVQLFERETILTRWK